MNLGALQQQREILAADIKGFAKVVERCVDVAHRQAGICGPFQRLSFDGFGAVRIGMPRKAMEGPADRDEQQRVDEHDDQKIDYVCGEQRIAA